MTHSPQLTPAQRDALQELVNIGVGQAAGTLNEMVRSHIHLQVPEVSVLSLHEAQTILQSRLNSDLLSSVRLQFHGNFAGVAQLIFPTDSAAKLVTMLTGEDAKISELDSLKIGTLSEIGNILLNGVMGTMSNVLEQHVEYSMPVYVEQTVTQLLNSSSDYASTVILAQARFRIEQLHITGDIILIFKVGSLNRFLATLKDA
ncbi:chemotaxis protein CheC [Spirulina sp. CS-785/01]|uniref:chemotaxis protein CheC n=1 Tax=Spirulina sp. CS-785/01 TaxID=3021716 RepID=UPI00232D647A|nr:chemotaxis protein CheC [Spirulina sp. CS-785/01]MDB9311995.1 chemotaxis protein CheC [Spirulina sp. CS-785/01]